jgi:hypothetical protein
MPLDLTIVGTSIIQIPFTDTLHLEPVCSPNLIII